MTSGFRYIMMTLFNEFSPFSLSLFLSQERPGPDRGPVFLLSQKAKGLLGQRVSLRFAPHGPVARSTRRRAAFGRHRPGLAEGELTAPRKVFFRRTRRRKNRLHFISRRARRETLRGLFDTLKQDRASSQGLGLAGSINELTRLKYCNLSPIPKKDAQSQAPRSGPKIKIEDKT